MSKWTKEAKEKVQSFYGGYCIMCEQLNEPKLPYHQFGLDEYERIRLAHKKKFKEE